MIQRKGKHHAEIIRDLLADQRRAMSVREIADALPSLTLAQVKASCFDMEKRKAVVKCGDSVRQLFRVRAYVPKPRRPRYNTPIAPSAALPKSSTPRAVETTEEWMRRTGNVVQRLPIGATAFPIRALEQAA